MADPDKPDLLSTGIPGLDTTLHGGLPARHSYLVRGHAGTGKTSMVLQFLSEGANRGESTVYISFSETLMELRRVAAAHGWPLDKIEVAELAAYISRRSTAGSSIFHSSEVELPDAISKIIDLVERVEPTRVGIDSLTELRNMAESYRAYRRALFQLKASLERLGTTTIFVGEKDQRAKTKAESLVHGVIDLQMETPVYGPTRRFLEIKKLRGRAYESGYHDFTIVTGGLEVFPRINPKDLHRQVGSGEPIRSGVESLDQLLGCGLDRGTTTLLVGPSGTGKSSVLMQYAIAAAGRGEKAVLYTFAEGIQTIKRRAQGMDLPLTDYLANDRIRIRSIDAGELSPGQFAHLVREDAKDEAVTFVAIDSLNGYIHAMPDEATLVPHLHNLLSYLGAQGIITMLVVTLSGLFKTSQDQLVNVSYLADTVLLFRYFEEDGAIYKSIAAVKQRTRKHEKYVRRLHLGPGGITVGEPIMTPTVSELLDLPSERHDDDPSLRRSRGDRDQPDHN